MYPFIILIFTSLTLAARPFSSTTDIVSGIYTVSVTPRATCLVGNRCPSGSACTPIGSCYGLCLISQTFPPVIPCTVGNNGPCPTGSVCTASEYCTTTIIPTPPCGGQCVRTSFAPPSNASLPTTPCEVGIPTACASNAFCTPTVACEGACVGTVVPPPQPTPTPTQTTTPTPLPTCG